MWIYTSTNLYIKPSNIYSITYNKLFVDNLLTSKCVFCLKWDFDIISKIKYISLSDDFISFYMCYTLMRC